MEHRRMQRGTRVIWGGSFRREKDQMVSRHSPRPNSEAVGDAFSLVL